uniref:NADH:ubiquinone oxidoreductase intermediate-associated protein 30 domain-containing protein n=1 Tax=Phlebotomus papatasi TaxID=29031 RepID=A0A1B0GNA1_PHLPP
MLARPHGILKVLFQSVRKCRSQIHELSSNCRSPTAKSEVILKNSRCLHTSPISRSWWEKDRKGGYNFTRASVSRKQMILDGLKELKTEIALWQQEVREKLESDPILIYRPGEVDVKFQFHQPKDLEKWVCTTDSDHNEGYSKASFDISPSGYGLFHGTLCNRVPIDGKIKRSGYANISSMRARKSFKRDSYHDWHPYNMLVMRIRGDGRSYLINIATEGYFDVLWNDVYHFALAESSLIFHPNIQYEVQLGITDVVLGWPDKADNRNAYYSPGSSTSEYVVSTKLLKNPRRAYRNNSEEFNLIGFRGCDTQNFHQTIDPSTAVIFFGQMQSKKILCWNTKRHFNPDTIGVIYESDALQFVSEINMDAEGYLWFHSSHLPLIYLTDDKQLNINDINSRTFRVKASEAIEGTVCDVSDDFKSIH